MKIVKGVFFGFIILLFLLVIGYFLGPVGEQPKFIEKVPVISATVSTVDDYIQDKELSAGKVKPDNQARIIWNDSIPGKTSYSIVYLHGFGASQGEGDPVHRNLADSLNANLYLSRLARHGLEAEEAYKGLSPEEYMESAAEALAIGELIGERVILVGTSTGGAQALYLASKFPDKIAAMVLYSPFIEMADGVQQYLSVGPWHDELTDLMIGSEINYEERADSVSAYWSNYYHVDAYKSLFRMVKFSTVPELIENIKMPVFMAYYYKDESNQDNVVSVNAMRELFQKIPSSNKKAIAFPKTGNHVIASKWRSHDWRAVQDSSYQFLKESLAL